MTVDTALGGKYKAYPDYKKTHLGWLSHIPSHWEVKRLKYLGDALIGLTYSPDEVVNEGEGTLVLRSSNIQNKQLAFMDNVYVNKKIANKLIVQKGDILICARNGSRALIGKNAQIDERAVGMSFGAFMSVFRSPYNDYLAKVFNSPLFEYQSGSFLTATINQLTTGNLNSFEIPLPTESERKKIANFLDHETAKIDTLIEKQQQLIKLLKEKRQAVISHAVTRGLPSTTGSNVPMRDSGVEWLGEVPAHWDVVPLKHLCTLLKDGTHLPPPRVDSGVPLLSVRNIINGKFVFRDDDSNISEKDYVSLCRAFIPQQGDVLLAIVGGTIGKVAIIDEMTKFHIQRSVAIFRTNKKILTSELLANIIGSSSFQSLLWENVGFSAQPGIYLGSLANFQLPIPPLNEQNDINEYCSSKSERINILIEKATSAVKLMQERRTVIISAAVTGKIDFRDWHSGEEEGS